MKDEQHAPLTYSASFRFYQELNDFLPQDLRKIPFPYEFTSNASVKDTIEAIGVPHTEIDLVLVNGKSVDFEHKLHGGEHVSVYPVFESFNITPLIHLRSEPLRVTKFVVDVNLGKLAVKLRLLGFDTLYRNDLDDREIVDISVSQRRIILTRDKGILKYRAVTHGYWVRNHDPKKQLSEVINRLQLEDSFQPFTRCSVCNDLLLPVDKVLVRGRVEEATFQCFSRFVECRGCQKVYWYGSHYERICHWIDELKLSQ
ncbi:Mut7-C ubiquitin/RNAse domain-containing protein [Photobacterium sp. SDRW27]|uniref:Mut7-C RNAse domain-containing protein n=1 Tax=Photobacterium obscurum TaxID=2829490 RepID=UPI0022434CCA|nr:Mut7-C RNAse domain-containing protein [Photobacterium obscurum]MCW8329456.1 Mut7-C ubiquitin/RNAse domain-containing protein [Photobacterium obscurum]